MQHHDAPSQVGGPPFDALDRGSGTATPRASARGRCTRAFAGNLATWIATAVIVVAVGPAAVPAYPASLVALDQVATAAQQVEPSGPTPEFAPALEPVVLDGIRSGTVTLADGSTSATVAMAAVDIGRSVLMYGYRGTDNDPSDIVVSGQLTNSTTLTFARYGNNGAVVIEWSVVEFRSGVSVQRGVASVTTADVNVPIAAVDTARSFPLVGPRSSGAAFGGDDFFRAAITSSTNLQISTISGGTNSVPWQVVTYDQASVQTGTVSFATTDATRTATITPVDTAKSWLTYSLTSSDLTGDQIGQALVRGQLTDSTTLTFDRSVTGTTITLRWYLVQFQDATLVQRGNAAFGGTTSTVDVALSTPAEVARSVATGGYLTFGGRSPYTSTEDPGVGWFTTKVTSSTSLRLQRSAAVATADLGWSVLTWPTDRTVVVNSTGTGGDASIGDGACRTATPGQCTLRAAIAEANAHPVVDTIHFAIPGAGPTWTIAAPDAVSGTPTITAPVTIDATTQPGWAGSPVVVLDGSAITGGDGFLLGTGSDGSTIRGFVIGGYPNGDGIQLTSSGNTIAGNWIGTDATGNVARTIPNGAGVYITGGTGNVVGGVTTADRNVIGATANGVNVDGEAVDGTHIVGNHLGVGANGAADIGNTGSGIVIQNGADTALVEDNVIGFNDQHGISIAGNTTGTVIRTNLIGVRADGTTSAPNLLHGVVVGSGASNNLVGGVAPGDGNTIRNAGSAQFDGVRVHTHAGPDNAIVGNAMLGNGDPGGLGIDLGAADVTANDAGDVDTGANDLLNFPVISSALASGATVDVSYALDVPAGNYRVEFFTNPSGADPTGYGEGESFVRAETISHAGLGSAGFTASFAGSAGDVITATLTEDLGGGSFGSTSEFSAAVTVASAIVVVNSTGDGVDQNIGDGVCQTATPGECTLRAAIQEADASAGIDTIHFAIPGPGPTWTITPGSALPTVTDAVTIDATTQTGWATTPVVVLDGVSSAGAVGLTIDGADTVVRGFAIGRFVRGLDVLGSAARAVIADNHIGVDAVGTTAFANDAQGLTAGADDVVISGNVVASNGADGIIVSGAARTRIVDNLIGTDATGNVALPNGQEGIEITGTTDVVIGEPGAGNVISGNRFAGINGWALGSTGVVVQSNLIGVGADGTTALGNGATVTEGGITFRAANSGWLIGGTGTGEGNVIANNVGDGIQLSTVHDTSTDIAVIGNEIFANTGLGVDHGDDDVTSNDAGDSDSGSNEFLNFPVISSVAVSGATVDVSYSLDVPAGNYRVEFFANPSGADPTGYGEGEAFVHAETITHAGLGTAGFTASLPATVGYITATTTEDLGAGSFGSTSEFSAAMCPDSDGDGLCFEDWNRDGDADPATDPGPDTDADTTPNYLDPDDDGDGIPTADENGDPNGNGDPRDAVDSDRDGQPDWLDIEAGPSSAPVAHEQKISATSGGLVGPLDDNDNLGQDVTGIGDLDGDGIDDLAVGVPEDDDGGTNRGAVYVLFMNANGTVRAEQKISDTAGGFTGVLTDFGEFGHGVATLGDVDGDGVTDIAVGTWTDVDGGPGRGAVWILFLERDGTVKAHRKISDTTGGLVATLDDYDRFGSSLSGLGDLDGDGTPDVAVGAREDDDGGTERGAAYILFLNADGSVRAEQKISDTAGGLTGVLDDFDEFGHDVAGIGDLDGDGIGDLAVGVPRDDDGGTDRGAAHVLFLNADGTVRAEQKLSATAGPLAAALDDHDWFGSALAGIGDLDGNGTPDLAVGARGDTDGAWNAGAVHLLRLAADGTVVGADKISATSGGLAGPLDVFDHFGRGIGSLGDLDGDGTLNLAVSARYDDDGGTDRGAVYILDLSPPPVPTVLVNSTGDAPDQTPGDGYCKTGAFNVAGVSECTLRAAIEEANASVIVDSIHFDIPVADAGQAAGVWTIEPSTALPPLTAAAVLDATSQPGWATTPVVALDGSGLGAATDGLTLGAGSGGSEVRGLAVGGFPGHGIVIDFGSGGNLIAGNHIGTDAGGLVDAGNGSAGILVSTDGNTIGGATAADRNVISGNDGYGIFVGATTGNVFEGNYIGVDVTGNTALGNTWNGIYLGGGGGNAVDGNVIGGHGDIAVRLESGANHVITANSIGVGADGISDVGNLVGVSARFGATDIMIGGSDPTEANVIVNNGHGVVVMDAPTARVAIVGNEIRDNDDLGIDLEDDGVTPNDTGDADTGPNELLNFPVITSATARSGLVDITFSLDVPAGTYRIEFFANPSGADPTGYGEGDVLVDVVTVSHPGGGRRTYTTRTPGAAGDVLTATTTRDLGTGDFGSTSEFSQATTVVTGSTVRDRSLRRNDLDTAGGATGTAGAGVAGTGVTLAGGHERLVGPATDLTSGAVTMSAWVRLDATSTAPRLVSKRSWSGAIYELLVDDVTGSAEARFGIDGSEVTVQGGTLTVGTWHQVAATWDGSTVRLYVDGVEVDRTPASGTLGADLSSPLVLGNVEGANRGLIGSLDMVQIEHTARSAAWIETAYLNLSNPTGFISIGEVETAAAGSWSASSSVARTGSGSLAAPIATGNSQAWATATGLDEPGLAFESWWYVAAPASSRIAAGTNTGAAPIEQRELGSTDGTVDLATRSVGNRTVDASSPAAVAAATWTRVEIRTDELGRSTAWIDGVEVIGPTPHGGGTSGGSAGLRAESVTAAGWYVDDVLIRRYVSDEPTTTLGPLNRN